MHFSNSLLALAATVSTASAQALKGFNYGATHTDNSPMIQSDFQTLFKNAQNLAGAPGFTSARLYTSIQAGTTDSPTSAIPAAIATKTKILLGLWASSGNATIASEINAINAAVQQYGSSFTDLVVGISVGSEDLYRDSSIYLSSLNSSQTPLPGASPADIANYIAQVKNAFKNSALKSAPVGHVDTWTAWVNSSVSTASEASDFIGMDAYPYFQSTMANGIDVAKSLFDSALAQTKGATGGKPVWVTETGWPVSGDQSNQATPNTANAKTYWDQVGCAELFGNVNTFWFTLQDASPATPNPSFGVLASGSTTPLYDLSCQNVSSSSPTSVSSASGSMNTASATDAGSPGLHGFSSAFSSGYSVATVTNSAGSVIATTFATNATAPVTGTPIAPTASVTGSGSGPGSSTVSTGGAVVKAGSVAGVFGAALAVIAAL